MNNKMDLKELRMKTEQSRLTPTEQEPTEANLNTFLTALDTCFPQ